MPDSTICKFRCASVTHFQHPSQEVHLRAEYDETLDEDRRFAKASPSGEMKIFISNPAIEGFFTPGQAYYLTITPA